MRQTRTRSKHRNKPLLSIIVPVLNEEKYIGQLLHLLLQQTQQNFEIIVVEGGSTDKTVSVVKGFIRQHLNINITLLLASHKGVSFQKNLGAKKAKADLLLFLDADVSFSSTFVAEALSEFNHHHFDIATTRWFPADTKSIDTILSFFYNRYQEMTRESSPVIYGWMILVKKELHKRVNGFDERLYFFEDTDYVKCIVKTGGRFQILPQVHLFSSSRRAHDEGRIAFEVKMIRFFIYYILFGYHVAQTKIKYSK